MSGKRSIFNYGNGKCKHKQSNSKYRFVLFYLHHSAHFIPWKLLCYYYLNTIREIFLNPKQYPMLLAHPSCAWIFYTQNAIRNLLFGIFQSQEDFQLKDRTQKRRFSENNSQIQPIVQLLILMEIFIIHVGFQFSADSFLLYFSILFCFLLAFLSFHTLSPNICQPQSQ